MGDALCVLVRRLLRGPEVPSLLKGLLPLVLCFLHSHLYTRSHTLGLAQLFRFHLRLCSKSFTRYIPSRYQRESSKYDTLHGLFKGVPPSTLPKHHLPFTSSRPIRSNTAATHTRTNTTRPKDMKPSAIGLELLSTLALLTWVRGATALPNGAGIRSPRRPREPVEPRAAQYGYGYGNPPPLPPQPPVGSGSTSGGGTGSQTGVPLGECLTCCYFSV